MMDLNPTLPTWRSPEKPGVPLKLLPSVRSPTDVIVLSFSDTGINSSSGYGSVLTDGDL